jgi:hypothetical protein
MGAKKALTKLTELGTTPNGADAAAALRDAVVAAVVRGSDNDALQGLTDIITNCGTQEYSKFENKRSDSKYLN